MFDARTLPTARLALFALSFGALAACGLIDDLDPVDACTAGRVYTCPCLGGDQGVQVCDDDGDGLGACVCPGDDGFDALSDDLADESTDPWSSDDGMSDGGTSDETGSSDDRSGDGTTRDDVDDAPPALPDPDVTLNDARVHVVVVGGAMSVSVRGDWTVEGRDDVVVDFEVLSAITYRSWTALATDLPPSFFADMNMPATQGENRFDFRVVARDANGGRWVSNVITVQ